MAQPQELSVAEIRKYMLANGCKVTNHALVKHFKRFLTHPQTQNEARKQFKAYVNILSTIKNENNQKFLILRKKYINECPSEEIVERAVAAASNEAAPSSPGGASIISESGSNASPFRHPPPYKPPPDVSTPTNSPVVISTLGTATSPAPTAMTGVAVQQEHVDSYRDCVQEFTTAIRRIDPGRLKSGKNEAENDKEIEIETMNAPKSISRANSLEESNNSSSNKENIPRFSFSSGNSGTSTESSNDAEKKIGPDPEVEGVVDGEAANPISVKEATRKFNRMASEEESRIISPPAKKRPEKDSIEEKVLPEVTLAHPKAKEWIVSMANANYQELAKLANDSPELVKLQDSATGYTALHWAAKHGNEDVVKLIAGTYRADVNARTNGGYTPLHLAIQFGRDNIFELLWNVYKANRDLMDWSGNKPLDYSQQRPSVSASTCSSEYRNYFHNTELNKNFNLGTQLSRNIVTSGGGTVSGGGGTFSNALSLSKKRSQSRYATFAGGASGGALARTQSLMAPRGSRRAKKASAQSVFLKPEPIIETHLMHCDIMPTGSATSPGNFIYNQSNKMKSPQVEASRNSRSNEGKDGIAQFKGAISDKDNYGTLTSTRRKESFLRKTFRAAAGVNRHNHDIVTNQTPTD